MLWGRSRQAMQKSLDRVRVAWRDICSLGQELFLNTRRLAIFQGFLDHHKYFLRRHDMRGMCPRLSKDRLALYRLWKNLWLIRPFHLLCRQLHGLVWGNFTPRSSSFINTPCGPAYPPSPKCRSLWHTPALSTFTRTWSLWLWNVDFLDFKGLLRLYYPGSPSTFQSY